MLTYFYLDMFCDWHHGKLRFSDIENYNIEDIQYDYCRYSFYIVIFEFLDPENMVLDTKIINLREIQVK